MIIGKPTNITNFVIVNSTTAQYLSSKGFVPLYREINLDNIYFYKTKELCEVIENWNLSNK